MPVLVPYMISRALSFSSSMARQALIRSSGVGVQLHLLAVAGDAHQLLDGQAGAVQNDGHKILQKRFFYYFREMGAYGAPISRNLKLGGEAVLVAAVDDVIERHRAVVEGVGDAADKEAGRPGRRLQQGGFALAHGRALR